MSNIRIPVIQCEIWIDCSNFDQELMSFEDHQFLSRITERKSRIFEFHSDERATWDTGEMIKTFLEEIPTDAVAFLQKYAHIDSVDSSLSVYIRFGSTAPAFFLSRELLSSIAILGLDIDFDIYSFHE